MNYWKGLVIAAAIDLGWIMGGPVATGPEPLPPREFAVAWSDVPLARPNGPVRLAARARPDAEELAASRLEDSLMTYLQENPDDVTAIEKIAGLYMRSGGYDEAINPLARALQLDPTRRSLWVSLDQALKKAGIDKITDKDLTLRAQLFVESVEMWGHGC